MSLTNEDQKKISKIGTSALTVRVQLGKFEGEELEYAISLLKKRHIDIDLILAKKATKVVELEVALNKAVIESPKEVYVEEEPFQSEDLPELFFLPENDGPQSQEEYDALQTIENTQDPLIEEVAFVPVKKEKKAKAVKKSSKHEKKIYTDANGKEMTKSDLMRRLIRLKNNIKPKELNEQLIDAGFEKAYYSEIQRCRQQMGVTPEAKE